MLRLDGNVLPAFTHPVARWMYDEPAMRELVEAGLGACGRIAREGGVRLGLHPGPFCVLASPNPAAVENGVSELEYHTDGAGGGRAFGAGLAGAFGHDVERGSQ